MDIPVFKHFYFLLALGIWASLSQTAYCQSKTVRQQIQATLQKADRSFQHVDVNGCLAMLTDDFQGIDISGDHFTKDQTRQSLVREFTPRHLITRSATIKSQVLDVISTGQQANVTYHEYLVITIVGQITHQQHVLTLDTLRHSTWVQAGNGWREQRETQVSSRIMQDGVLKSVKSNKQ